MFQIRRILVATDFSPATEPAFSRAVDLAKSVRAELVIFHVIEPVVSFGPEPFLSPGVFQAVEEAGKVWSQRQLDGLIRRARLAHLEAEGTIASGSAWQEIVRAADSQKADLIILGTQGRSGISRLFLGSVAARVVAAAPCPVMTVRAALVEKQPEAEEMAGVVHAMKG